MTSLPGPPSIASSPTLWMVSTPSPPQIRLVPGAAEQDVVTATAPYPVVAVDDIVSDPPADLVVSAPTLDHGGNGDPPPHRVVALAGRGAPAAHPGGGGGGARRALHPAPPRAAPTPGVAAESLIR